MSLQQLLILLVFVGMIGFHSHLPGIQLPLAIRFLEGYVLLVLVSVLVYLIQKAVPLMLYPLDLNLLLGNLQL